MKFCRNKLLSVCGCSLVGRTDDNSHAKPTHDLMASTLLPYRQTIRILPSLARLEQLLPKQRAVAARIPIASFHLTSRRMGEDDWKERAPYAIHKSGDDFHARYEGSCHCGRVSYQLSREKPLDAKYCHCTTCQTLHGRFSLLSFFACSTKVNPMHQEHHSNGPPFSIRRISTSLRAMMTWCGMTVVRRRPGTNCLVRLLALIADRPSWMKEER